MQKLIVFNSVSLDGYFVDGNGGMNWAHNPNKDEEWDAFVAGNASGGGILLFGRITYDCSWLAIGLLRLRRKMILLLPKG